MTLGLQAARKSGRRAYNLKSCARGSGRRTRPGASVRWSLRVPTARSRRGTARTSAGPSIPGEIDDPGALRSTERQPGVTSGIDDSTPSGWRAPLCGSIAIGCRSMSPAAQSLAISSPWQEDVANWMLAVTTYVAVLWCEVRFLGFIPRGVCMASNRAFGRASHTRKSGHVVGSGSSARAAWSPPLLHAQRRRAARASRVLRIPDSTRKSL